MIYAIPYIALGFLFLLATAEHVLRTENLARPTLTLAAVWCLWPLAAPVMVVRHLVTSYEDEARHKRHLAEVARKRVEVLEMSQLADVSEVLKDEAERFRDNQKEITQAVRDARWDKTSLEHLLESDRFAKLGYEVRKLEDAND